MIEQPELKKLNNPDLSANSATLKLKSSNIASNKIDVRTVSTKIDTSKSEAALHKILNSINENMEILQQNRENMQLVPFSNIKLSQT